MEPAHPLNQVCHVPESGLVLMAVEDPKMQAYYIPVSQLLWVISGLTGAGRGGGWLGVSGQWMSGVGGWSGQWIEGGRWVVSGLRGEGVSGQWMRGVGGWSVD